MRKTRTTTARLHKKIKFNSGNIIQIRSLSWTKIDRKHRTKTRLLNGCALKNVQNNCAPQNQKEKREWRQRETTAVCIRNVTRHLVVTLHFWNNLCWHILANCTAPSQPNGNLVNGHRMKEKIKTIKFIILLLPYTDDSLVVYMLSFFFFRSFLPSILICLVVVHNFWCTRNNTTDKKNYSNFVSIIFIFRARIIFGCSMLLRHVNCSLSNYVRIFRFGHSTR